MKFAELTLSLLVAFSPTAANCDPGDEAPPPVVPESPPPPESVAPPLDDADAGSAETTVEAPLETPPPIEGPTEMPTEMPAEMPAEPVEPAAPNDVAPAEPGDFASGGVAPGDFAPGEVTSGDFASGGVAPGDDADSYEDTDPSALSDFHDALDPYGTWTDDPTVGTVWVPSPDAVGPNFRPYVTAGRWTYDSDWVWISEYAWGWAPFHYGRWVFVSGRGWSWVPGRVYRGAWVTWSTDATASYVGWAPTPPAFVWIGGVATGRRGAYVAPRWVYCPRAAVLAPALASRVIVGAAAAPLAARMRLFVAPAGGTTAGPAPERLGYSASQVPRPTATALTRAIQFARPSTALALGARPPARTALLPSLPGPGYAQPPGGRSAALPNGGPAGPALPNGGPAAPLHPGGSPSPAFSEGPSQHGADRPEPSFGGGRRR